MISVEHIETNSNHPLIQTVSSEPGSLRKEEEGLGVVKIDTDMRLLLRQEMKETDRVVFHTSHSLSTPGSWKTREPVSEKRGQRWKNRSVHRSTDGHELTLTEGKLGSLATHTHTDVLLYGCHDNRFHSVRMGVCMESSH